MPVMTYTSLLTDLESFLERTDISVVAMLPTLIGVAEFRCARETKSLGTMSYVTGSFNPNSPVYPKPGLWLDTVTFNVASSQGSNTRSPVMLRTYDYIRAYWPDPTATGIPAYYADYDFNHWIVAPTPATALAFEVGYYGRPQPLSSDNETNWFTQNAPDLILYAALLETTPYLRADERVPVWQDRYDRAKAAILGEDQGRRTDRQAIPPAPETGG